MARILRVALVALIAALVGLGGALPSTAAVDPAGGSSEADFDCANPPDGYPAPARCELDVQVLEPVCDKGVPKLRYQVAAVGSPNTTVTLTWINPTGADVVYPDLPLQGTVNWPGALAGADGVGTDWPGWTELPDGSWAEGDAFDWVRPGVEVLFQVNPEALVTVSYPKATTNCVAGPPDDEVLSSEVLSAGGPTSAVLSATGSETGPLLMAGAGLVLLGGLAVAGVTVARRRRASV